MRTQGFLLLPDSSHLGRYVCVTRLYWTVCLVTNWTFTHGYLAACESHAGRHEWSPNWGESWRLRARRPQKRLRAGIQLLDFFYFGSVLRSTDLQSTKQGRPGKPFPHFLLYSVKALIQTESNATQAGVLPFLPHYVLSVYIVQRNYFKKGCGCYRILLSLFLLFYFFCLLAFFSTIVDIISTFSWYNCFILEVFLFFTTFSTPPLQRQVSPTLLWNV